MNKLLNTSLCLRIQALTTNLNCVGLFTISSRLCGCRPIIDNELSQLTT